MKKIQHIHPVIALLTATLLVFSVSCQRDFDELEPAGFPTTPEVFIDGFSAGLAYAAFGGSNVTAFDVDDEVKYAGTSSMRFAVPDAGDPKGAYAGGVYYTIEGRDLSGYDALTFWAKASKSATIDLVGFGNDLKASKYLAYLQGVKVNTNWKKYIIPIPEASLLTEEKGMFYYSEGPEEGLGYTFWIDELKFEKLGTIAHKRPVIFNGEDAVESTVNGIRIPLTGTSFIFNMPDGIDQAVYTSSAYFTFTSSNTAVATIDSTGMVSVLSEGTSVITAKSGDVDAGGSLTVNSAGDFVHAPEPTIPADRVISIFSDAYNNVPVDFYNGYWEPFQTTLSADFTVNDDHVLNYTNFNFVGIQFTSPPIDASGKDTLHMDVWIPNAVTAADKLSVKIVDMGADGALDGNDPSISYEIPGPLTSQTWISVDISLSGLSSKSRLAQIILENLQTSLSGFYLDNVYLYGSGGGTTEGPSEAAPAPPAREEGDVISIYSDGYTNLEGTDYPDWGQATVLAGTAVEGNNTLKLSGLDYQGVQLAASQNLTGMEYLHVDFWTDNSSSLNVYLISTGPVEKAYALTVPTTGWSSVDIPLSDFSPVDLADVIQMKFDGNGTIYLDNIYFYTSGGGTVEEPATAAPTPPARDAGDVLSLFSNEYTNETVGTWSASWDDSDVADLQVMGDDIKKYTFTNFAGIDFSDNKLDASAMTHFHMDIWTPDDVISKSLSIKMVDFGGGSAEATSHILTVVHTAAGDVPPLATGSWVSIDVPITAFTGDQTRSDLAQIVLSSNLGTLYIDNLYMYKTGGGGACEDPAEAPPAPMEDAADVISVFSDAYTDIANTNFNPGWGQSTAVTTESIGSGSSLKYDNFNFQGTNLGGPDGVDQDLSSMEYLHIDMWTCDATVVQVSPISRSTGEKLVSLTPLKKGQWNSYDIPLSDFPGVSMADIFQLKFDGQAGTSPSKIFLDNIYFYTTGGGGTTTGPATAAPTPPVRAAGNVVSIYSDAYAGTIAFDNFDAGWCGGAAVTGVTIEGNNTLKKNAGIECHGIDFSSDRQDLSSFTHIHFDFYTDDVDLTGDVFNVKLVDFAGGGGEASALEVNINTGTNPAIVSGTWVSVDIDITALGGIVTNNLTRSDVAQIGITTANLTNVWYDNIYLYK